MIITNVDGNELNALDIKGSMKIPSSLERTPSQYMVKGLFPSWTLKSFLAPLKYVNGLCTHPMTTLVYILRKNVKVSMELEVPQMPIFRPTLSIVMV